MENIKKELVNYLEPHQITNINDLNSIATHYLKSKFERDSVASSHSATGREITYSFIIPTSGELATLIISLDEI